MKDEITVNFYQSLEKIQEVNRTDKYFPEDTTIQELFQEQVNSHSNHSAVICDSGKNIGGKNYLTYKELNDKSNQLARLLRRKGVGPDRIVGIMTERSFEMIIGLFGILKAGGAYLPISPDSPVERIKYMLNDSDVKLLLVQHRYIAKTEYDGDIINLEDPEIYSGISDNLIAINGSRDLAYVIYTSGSTGKPKGVMVEHRSLVNRLTWMQNKYPLHSEDIILQKTPFYFDVSLWELFWWSLFGAKMCFLMPGGERLPMAIVETINKHKISILHFVPSMLNVFLEYLEGKDEVVMDKLSSVRRIFVSGEALSPSHVKKFNTVIGKNTLAKMTNLYGPTETTVDVTYYECPSDNHFNKIPIGKPIDNIRCFIIKNDDQLCFDEAGELCISGVGLARGYINNPEMTSQKFVDNPFLPGEKMYRTGDIARWLPDGNIEYLGREDHQVKISGLRIELGEIENKIREHHNIKDAVAITKKYSESIILIIAYIVCNPGIDINELKNYLKRYLPDYMIPNHFEKIDSIPLTANGKADRNALPEPAVKIRV